MKYIVISILVLLFYWFLYWTYLPDYKRNPKEFLRVLIGMPIGMLLVGIGFHDLNEKIREWAVGKKDSDEKKD